MGKQAGDFDGPCHRAVRVRAPRSPARHKHNPWTPYWPSICWCSECRDLGYGRRPAVGGVARRLRREALHAARSMTVLLRLFTHLVERVVEVSGMIARWRGCPLRENRHHSGSMSVTMRDAAPRKAGVQAPGSQDEITGICASELRRVLWPAIVAITNAATAASVRRGI